MPASTPDCSSSSKVVAYSAYSCTILSSRTRCLSLLSRITSRACSLASLFCLTISTLLVCSGNLSRSLFQICSSLFLRTRGIRLSSRRMFFRAISRGRSSVALRSAQNSSKMRFSSSDPSGGGPDAGKPIVLEARNQRVWERALFGREARWLTGESVLGLLGPRMSL